VPSVCGSVGCRTRWLTADQIGALLGGIPPKTVLQYARGGRLPCVRIGKHVRFVRVNPACSREHDRELAPVRKTRIWLSADGPGWIRTTARRIMSPLL
jgi:hypothetical protein